MVRISEGSAVATAAADSVPEAAKPADYRLDLDGLRGVAIALVVAFHVWFGKVSGGVDVFLVLSGFFFTGMLLRRAEADGGIGLWQTFRRTARRLLPALFVVLALVVVMTVAEHPYTQWADMSGQTVASALYYQNWYLANAAADYLAADPSVSPLQHLWSMAVQGQFYIAITLLLAAVAWGCRRAGRREAIRPAVAALAVVLGIASFVYAALRSTTYQEWIYYDSAARAWELLVGALLAVVVPFLRVPARWWAKAGLSLLAAAGLLAVLTCGILFDGARQFPGPAALFPVGAAVALILAGVRTEAGWTPAVSRLLATRPMVELGAVAYALYLWHWPLLIYYLIRADTTEVTLGAGVLIIGLSLVLAVLTNRLIEEPLRLRSGAAITSPVWLRRGAAVAVTVVAALVLGVSGFWQGVLITNPARPIGALDPVVYPGAEALLAGATVPPARVRPSVLEAPGDVPASTIDGCISDWFTTEITTCTYGDPAGTRTMAVVGNSHAEHWLPALDALGHAHGVKVVVLLKMGCPLNIREDAKYRGLDIPDCRDWSRAVIDRLGAERPDWVFTTATEPQWPIGGDRTPDEFVEVWSAMAERQLNVLAIRDTPWLRNEKGTRYRAVDCLAAGGNAESCGIARSEALSPVNPAVEPAAAFPNVHLLDLSDAVCGPEVCRVVIGNVLVYHDEHHMTASYVRTIAPELERQIGATTGWW
ncbi:acyltransferase family protein [Nocardia cyriacigeorgica]|uniref:acyltransferase family protein n=1 Tax=Nocardia cyriacigeorgica TaxID=135487 RepID=UPI0018947822|nr:acyltransferase family protein [Nocardia cyriacigeorgica]MBF6456008.1 acyltransferase [Nocardia cyriacigeorgica]MBF6478455.1 acyltransferase [Nocardia cyriacigeorgica]MBF6553251.1 acyltransferase [Nocardia cyriacigeorgica]